MTGLPTGPAADANGVRSRGGPRRAVMYVVVAAVALVLLVGIGLPAGLMYRRTHPPRTAVDDDPGRHGLAYVDVAFPSRTDATILRGWYLPAGHPTGRAIVIAPGIDDDRLVSGITLRLAPALVAAGFDVLAFDFRAEGESDGDTQTFGARERGDVLGAMDEARRRGASVVGVLGFSLGAGSALLAAADSTGIAAVMADSPFADLRDALHHELAVNMGLPEPIAAYGLLLFQLFAGVDPSSVRPVDAIAALGDRPVLLVRGDQDRTVPREASDRLLAAARPSTERWIVPDGGHARSYLADPTGYTARALAFFERSLVP